MESSSVVPFREKGWLESKTAYDIEKRNYERNLKYAQKQQTENKAKEAKEALPENKCKKARKYIKTLLKNCPADYENTMLNADTMSNMPSEDDDEDEVKGFALPPGVVQEIIKENVNAVKPYVPDEKERTTQRNRLMQNAGRRYRAKTRRNKRKGKHSTKKTNKQSKKQTKKTNKQIKKTRRKY